MICARLGPKDLEIPRNVILQFQTEQRFVLKLGLFSGGWSRPEDLVSVHFLLGIISALFWGWTSHRGCCAIWGGLSLSPKCKRFQKTGRRNRGVQLHGQTACHCSKDPRNRRRWRSAFSCSNVQGPSREDTWCGFYSARQRSAFNLFGKPPRIHRNCPEFLVQDLRLVLHRKVKIHRDWLHRLPWLCTWEV